MNIRISTSALLSVKEIDSVLAMKDANLEALFADAFKIASETKAAANSAIEAAEAELQKAQEKYDGIVAVQEEKLGAAEKVLAIARRLVRS